MEVFNVCTVCTDKMSKKNIAIHATHAKLYPFYPREQIDKEKDEYFFFAVLLTRANY